MRTTHARRTTAALTAGALGVGLMLGLAGCDPDRSEEALTVTERPAETKAPKGDRTPTTPPDDGGSDDGGSDDGGSDDGGSDGPSCLEGAWEADVDSQVATLQDTLGDMGSVLDVSVTGGSSTVYADGRLTTTYDNQVVTTTMDLGGQTLVSITRYDGATSGSYTATDTTVMVSDIDASGLTLEISNVLDGTELDLGTYTTDLLTSLEADASFTYTCSGDTAVLTPSAPGMDMSAYAVTLHRR